MSSPAQSNENILKAEKAAADPRGSQAEARFQGEAAEALAKPNTSEKPMLKGGAEKWSDGINHGDRYERQFDKNKVTLPAKDASKESTTSYPEAQPAYNEQGKLDHIDIKPTLGK